jgi:hypothetical protein
MVLPLKRWKSRTSPGFVAGAMRAEECSKEPIYNVDFRRLRGRDTRQHGAAAVRPCGAQLRFVITSDIGGAGWSSPVARQAHNLKVVGSNPTPATNKSQLNQ